MNYFDSAAATALLDSRNIYFVR